jgi:steroid 5-alpha reductase family enzyme
MNGLSLAPLLHVLLATAVVMALGWEIQRRSRNAGIVDAIWAASMGGAAVYYASIGEGCSLPRLLVAMLGGIWAARLSLFLLHRVLREPEDGRYAYLRAHWRDSQPKFFGFFMLQAGFTALFSMPFLVAASSHRDHWDGWIIVGVLVWAGSLAGESIADRQLARYRADPSNRGKTCRVGLWRYSRHPNYFFEWLHWFGWVFISIGSPWWWLALIGPLLMGASLLWITGIPFTEAQSLRSRGDDYRRYQQETSMFFPWFPRGRDS